MFHTYGSNEQLIEATRVQDVHHAISITIRNYS